MGNRFPLLRLVLRCYPAAFRNDYEAQLLQTLADMLDDEPSRSGRLAVWLRTLWELPFSIVHERTHQSGGSVMQSITRLSNKRLLAGAAVLGIIGLLVAGYVFRIDIESRVVPKAYAMRYGGEMQSRIESERAKIGDPYMTLFGQEPTLTTQCNGGGGKGMQIIIDCTLQYSQYHVLPTDSAGKERTLQSVKTLDDKLRSAGYVHGSNGVTITSLVTGTYQKIDYSPDAFYEQTSGDKSCRFDVNIAYSNPRPAAILMRQWCDRTFYLFGKAPVGSLAGASL